ncbi:unnamed protein product [Brassica napus]|uniref:(rape) hypothetical protein n=1 Tax=Brassica napus TaxID=3708 RepID=A0A816K9R0_BRANA|nr:unnamed protein product [Brassica napus]
MANIFLIASGSRRTRRNPKEKRSNTNSIPDNNFSCKKHTKHRQSPGICSLCLTDRLSKVSLEYYSYTKNAAQTALSYCSSTSSSPSPIIKPESKIIPLLRSILVHGKKHIFLFRLLLGSIVD